jgi:hypothetical protein
MNRAVIVLSALVFSLPAFAAEDFAPVALNSLSAAPKIVSAPAVSYDAQKNLVVADTAKARLDRQAAAS